MGTSPVRKLRPLGTVLLPCWWMPMSCTWFTAAVLLLYEYSKSLLGCNGTLHYQPVLLVASMLKIPPHIILCTELRWRMSGPGNPAFALLLRSA